MRRLVLGLGCGVLVGCFDAPSADVMFSCDPASAPACPSGYTCEVDGCCHRDGSDVDAHAGECKLQGGTDAATTLLTGATTGTSTGTESSTGTGSSDTGTTTDASTSIATTESSSSAADTSSGGASSSEGSDTSATGESSSGTTT